MYQGISVQVLDTQHPVYHSQSIINQNNADSFNSLDEYNIESLILADPAFLFKTNLPDIPQSVLDEYVPCNFDNEPVNDRWPLVSGFPFVQQVWTSGNESGVEPTPASDSSRDYQSVPTAPQKLRPVAVVNPLSLSQTTSDKATPQAEKFVDNNSSIAECRRERQGKCRRELSKNPAYAERKRERNRKLRQNPAYAERQRIRERERQRELRKDPAYVERHRERQRKRRQNPVYVERLRIRERERLRERSQNDPDLAKRIKEQKREYQRKLRQNPAYAQRERERARVRYQNAPDFVERRREYNRRHYLNNRDFAEIERNRQKDVSKTASMAREQCLLSANSTGKPDELL
ncbi:hypothetical protein [Endozoicomonas sp. SESOKO1]|uniref:hypothetical protein n=1 Tax=Endozoicomonas sp. SESOKO1 TaxID=2828742 RepID=UPI002147580B|nr:hypothetical protein [Endozoicomonas sp. SESOKO1]